MPSGVVRLIELQELPFGSTSIYAQFRVFRLVQEAGIKVMLDGQGADELFAGYRPHTAALIGSYLGKWRFLKCWRLMRATMKQPGARLLVTSKGQCISCARKVFTSVDSSSIGR